MKNIIFKVVATILAILTLLTMCALDSDGFFFEKVLAILMILDGIMVYAYNKGKEI